MYLILTFLSKKLMIRRMFDNKMNEVTFTISHCNDCPESIFWKFGPPGNIYMPVPQKVNLLEIII